MTQTIALADLDSTLEDLLIGSPMPSGERLLGIEVEYLVLHRATQESAPLEFCRQLIAGLAVDIGATARFDGEVLNRVDGSGFSFTMEPGGQLELATDPCVNLAQIDPTMSMVRALVDARLSGTDYELVSLGHAPVTPVEELGLLPRSRYRLMDASMVARGPLTRNMMRGTAGFQLAYDVEDREDAGRKMALLYRLAPVMLALTANSRMVAGVDSGYESFRHHVWLETDRERVGVPDGCLHAETAVDGYKRFAREATMLFLRRDNDLVEAPEQSLEAAVATGIVTGEDLELHLTSLFPFVRLRNYLEVRYLDAVAWPLARSVLALLSGIVYCPYATRRAEQVSDSLVPPDSAGLRALHENAAREGLEARTLDGIGFRELAREFLKCSEATIGSETCNWSEPGDLIQVARHIG